jgi:hypothetical protein
MGWYYHESDYPTVHSFPRHKDVNQSSEQWWIHGPEMEYLAANPLFVPGLGQILASAIHQEASFTAKSGAFFDTNNVSARERSYDIFFKLPKELRFDILNYLSSRAIANLRLATRAYHQLPISLWRRLLKEELPWLWEVWSSNPPYIWATITPAQLQQEASAAQQIQEGSAHVPHILHEELPERPAEREEWTKTKCDSLTKRPDLLAEAQKNAQRELVSLPLMQTNWYEVYMGITRNWGQLKGLHNRERIWRDVEEIIRRVRKYRDEGVIVG